MISFGHGSVEQTILNRYLFIVNINIGGSRFGAYYDELHVVFNYRLIFPITGVEHHFVYGGFFDDVRIEVVSHNTELVM